MIWEPVVVTIALSLASVFIAFIGMQRAWKNSLEKEKKELKDAACTEGKDSGQIRSDMGYLRKGVDDIMTELREQRQTNVNVLTRLTGVEASSEQAHKRIDALEDKKYPGG